MPDITNPQVVRFSNEVVRPLADELYKTWFLSKSALEDYAAGDIGTKINDAGSSNFIGDGSDVDGRTRITGGDIFNFITALQEFIDYVENGTVTQADRTDVITKPHVNGI